MAAKTDKEKLYLQLINGYTRAFPSKTKTFTQQVVSQMWRDMKKNPDLDKQVAMKLQELKSIELNRKAKCFSFWAKASEASQKDASKPQTTDMSQNNDNDFPNESSSQEPHDSQSMHTVIPTPKQDKLKSEIQNKQFVIDLLKKKKGLGTITDEEKKSLLQEQQDLMKLNKTFQKVVGNQKRQQKLRDERKRCFAELDESTQKKLKLKSSAERGRPRIVEDTDALMKTICDIAIGGSGADERRRSEVIRSLKTLDDLTEALRDRGYNLSRSSVYLHLRPRNVTSSEGKRHVASCPVKLAKSESSLHKYHPDTKFAKSSLSNLEELSSILGPREVTFHSQDDKCRVALGIPAASKQAPILMHADYKVRLPDHDFVVAPAHKLIPSVIAACNIKENAISHSGVTYSGPTYVAIRSARHQSSTALTHLEDMKRVRELKEFEDSLTTDSGLAKPVMIVTCDGGPDENPRYQKTINASIDYFCNFDLDALFVATNAPGRSAYNRVERRMAPLTHDISGVILPHNHFGSHLDSQGRTVDNDLEMRNFEHAGKVLAEIWSNTVIDGHPVVSEYISNTHHQPLIDKCQQWRQHHVRESQYMLQIIKCSDTSCCSSPRSSYFSLVKDRFLPPPMPLVQSADGLVADITRQQFAPLFVTIQLGNAALPARALRNYSKGIPYDYGCPSLQDELPKRLCQKCGHYTASVVSLNKHKQFCTGGEIQTSCKIRPVRLAARRQRELMCSIKYHETTELEWIDEECVDTAGLQEPPHTTVGAGTPILPTDWRTPMWEVDD